MSKSDNGYLEACFAGRKLYGDDFSDPELLRWYNDEAEAYAGLAHVDAADDSYSYYELNQYHGFSRLGNRRFGTVLGFGSARGGELLPLGQRIERLILMDSSSKFSSTALPELNCTHVEPNHRGTLPKEAENLDLIVCFGVLHHIANVSDVLCELRRCLTPDGLLLVREPIISLGDWTRPRAGLTKRERGIPLKLFRRMIKDAGLAVERESLCISPLVSRLWQLVGRRAYNSRLATVIDHFVCEMTKWNYRYHAVGILGKIRPTSAFYILRAA